MSGVHKKVTHTSRNLQLEAPGTKGLTGKLSHRVRSQKVPKKQLTNPENILVLGGPKMPKDLEIVQ